MPARPKRSPAKSNGHLATFLPDDSIRTLTQAFRLLSDDRRLRLLLLLAKHGERNVGQLCDELGQRQPAVSHHLGLLRVAGMVESRRQGKHNLYRVRSEFLNELLLTLAAAGLPPEGVELEDFAIRRRR